MQVKRSFREAVYLLPTQNILENVTYDGKEKTSPPQKLPTTSVKFSKFFLLLFFRWML